jgi:hypothetical protein
LSVWRATLADVEVTELDIARIPVRNLRVPRAEFAAVWAAAKRRCHEQADRGVTDWYVGGIAATCQWMASAIVRTRTGRRLRAYSPVTERTDTAYEELIEAEYLAAELIEVRQPTLAAARPGWCEAVRATLRWAWRRNGPPPIPLPATAPTPG